MYPTIQPTLSTNIVFHLQRNQISVGANRLFLGLGVWVFPSLFANSIYYSTLELQGTSLWLATGTTSLLLLNLAIYLLNKQTTNNRTLIIGFDEISVLENSKVLYSLPLEAVKVTALTWGMEEGEQLPAIRISGKGFPCMTIGSRTSAKVWKQAKQSVDCTTFLINQEQKWENLLSTLSTFLNKN